MTQDELNNILDYNPTKDEFTWLISTNRRIKIGDRAGCIDKSKGYRHIRINGKDYLEHRLVWLWYNGYLPTKDIDHINGIKDDNRICNLREATPAENGQNFGKFKNNTTGFTGASFHKRTGKWQAQISKNGKAIHLGLFNTPEEAHDVYLKAKANLHTFQPVPR
jgi:hypothetical protein